MGGYTERVLKWFNYYSRARALTSCFVEASPTVEKLYRARNGPTCLNYVAKSPQRSFVACSTRICAAGEERCPCVRTCDAWCWAPKAHQNDRCYVTPEDLPSDSQRKDLKSMVGVYTENLKTVKIGGGEGVGACTCTGAWLGQYGMLVSSHLHSNSSAVYHSKVWNTLPLAVTNHITNLSGSICCNT